MRRPLSLRLRAALALLVALFAIVARVGAARAEPTRPASASSAAGPATSTGAPSAAPDAEGSAAAGAEIKPSGPTAADWSAYTPLPVPKAPAAGDAEPTRIPPPAPDLTGLLGLPVTRVVSTPDDASGWGGIAPPVLTAVKPGQKLDGAAARAALDEALATGRFASGRVSAVADGGGVALIVRLVPRKIIDRLEVDLHGAEIDRDEVLRDANLASGGEYIGSSVEASKQAITDVFLRHGYPSANVSLLVRPTDDPTEVTVLLDVIPGRKRVVEKRWFYLYGAAPNDVRSILEDYAVAVRARVDETALASADATLEAKLRAAGYYKASVFHDVVLVPRPSPLRDPLKKTITTLRVKVETGPKYELRFDGSDHYDDATLVGAIGADAETDRTSSHFADKLHDFYAKRGFLDVEVTPETRGADTDKIVAYVFHVIEHHRVYVRSRTYPCLNPREVSRLNGSGPRSSAAIGSEIDSYLEEELPGGDFLKNPDAETLDTLIGPTGTAANGTRAAPIELDPDHTYVEDTYDSAVTHVQELYRNEGFLHALVGPVQVIRAQCKSGTMPNKCVPVALPPIPTNQCTFDGANLPAAVLPLPEAYTCRPNPTTGVECAPFVDILIPVKLGPRTRFYDLAFEGAHAVSEKELAARAALDLGQPVNTLKIEDARKRLLDLYKDKGFFWVDVKYALDYSLDNTNARVRFQITEGLLVSVKEIIIHGNNDTNESVIRDRIVLVVGQPYSSSKVRTTQQFLGALGVFSSIDIQLEDQYVPATEKRVVITLVEKVPEYVQGGPGFSTGEGFRGAFEYGNVNIAGEAVSLTFHFQLSYLPDPLIFDPTVRANIQAAHLSPIERLARRNTISIGLPEIGLGPRARTTLDLIDVQDLERDFALTKDSLYGTIVYNLAPKVQVSAGQSVEFNQVKLFTEPTIQKFLEDNQDNPDLSRLLREPQGQSLAFAQRVTFTWDRRDSAFNAHSGTFISSGAELVNWVTTSAATVDGANGQPLDPQPAAPYGHFVHLTQTVAGYVPLSKSVTFAAELRVGQNVHLSRGNLEQTFPDRLFFLGGPDSMRGWLLDAFVPQEYVNKIAASAAQNLSASSPNRFTSADVPIRGGDFMVNARFELRFPVKLPIESVLFVDTGNVWQDPAYLFTSNGICQRDGECGPFRLGVDVGSGLRIATPVGPLVFDYGINVTRQSYDDFGAFNFSIGLF